MNKANVHYFPHMSRLNQMAIGFDSLFDQLESLTSRGESKYPPYNIIQPTETTYVIELAVSGWTKEELSLSVENNVLVVRGKKNESRTEPCVNVLHQGISFRNFTQSFRLAEHIEVGGAEVENGILRINLQRVMPEELKPKTIPIKFKE